MAKAVQPRHRWFAAAYDRFIEPSGRERMEPLRRFAAGAAHGRVLEIGAGNGSNLPYYDWARVESLDLAEPDPYMAERLYPRLRALSSDVQSRVHVYEAVAEDLPFLDDAFDCVVVTLVLCTVQDLQKTLAELRRVLRPGGELRLVEHVRAGVTWSAAQKLVQPLYGRLSGGCHLDRDTEHALRLAGFNISVRERTELAGPFLPALSAVATKPAEPLPRAMPARSLQRRRRLLKRGIYLIDRHLLRHPDRYLLQATLAAITLGAVVAVEDALTNAAIVTAIASSAFIIFMAPNATLATPRRVIGGHSVGIAIGLIFGTLAREFAGQSTLAIDLSAAAAVGVCMLAMAATDTEHPPGAGTVLGLVLAPNALANGALVMIAAVVLSLARLVFKRWLIDLM